MSSSGLIYLAILAAWAVYLGSRCLRTPGHQPESLPPADGAVLRRRGRPDRYAAYTEAEPDPITVPVVKNRRADLGPRGGRPPAAVAEAVAATTALPRPPLRVSRAAARRRRRVLGLLTAAVLVTSGLAGLAYAPTWAPLVPALLLLTYVVELRAQARRARARLARVHRPVPLPIESVVEAVGGARRVLRPAKVDDVFVDPWPAFDDAASAAAAKAKAGADWEPVPVPLPTYVTAPKAERPAFAGRKIDVTAGTSWVASATEDTTPLPVIAVAAEEKPEDGTSTDTTPQAEAS